MKEIHGNGFYILLAELPYLAIYILFALFFYRAVFYKGLQKMRFFTVLIAGFSAASVLLYPIVLFADLTPVRFFAAPDGIVLQQLLDIALAVSYILAAVFIFLNRSMRVATYTWLVILLFNTIHILRNGYLFLTWVKPAEPVHTGGLAGMIMEHVRHPRREAFLYGMIHPSFWIIISIVCLVKIRKERAGFSDAPAY